MSRHADLLITGGMVVDGTGDGPRREDVALVDDRIVAVGHLTAWTAADTIDASERIVCPGFIDTHSHDDRALLDQPSMEFKVSQGVTTVIAGNCGVSSAPFDAAGSFADPMRLLSSRDGYFACLGDYRAALAAEGHGCNIAMLTGHSMLRAAVLGEEVDRPARGSEITAMQRQFEAELQAGSAGLSTGLEYPAAHGSSTEEIVAVAEMMRHAPHAVYATHIRDEGAGVLGALEEAFSIGRAGDVPTVLSHHKCAGRDNHGRSIETLALIEAAAAQQPITLDVYPYTAGSTVLEIDRVTDSEKVLIAASDPIPDAAGRWLTDLAAEWEVGLEEAAARLSPAAAVYFLMSDADLERIISHPLAMIGSDGIPGMPHPHPRLWGTFSRVLGEFVRNRRLLSMPEAVRRMTTLPARTFGLADRGELAVGRFADLVVFDPETISDRATYEFPEKPSSGIDAVIVNGQPVWGGHGALPSRPGRFLARAG